MKRFFIIQFLVYAMLSSTLLYGQTLQQANIWVNGACGMCQERIQKTALSVKGVKTAEWNVDSKILSIEIDPSEYNEAELCEKLASAGHDTKSVKAAKKDYNSLHVCCKYRENSGSTSISGTVYGLNHDGSSELLIGANIYWQNSTLGTITDINGKFVLNRSDETTHLVVSYIGFGRDTFIVDSDGDWEFTLDNSVQIDEVEVSGTKNSAKYSFIAPQNTQIINSRELTKAACCNLSESFETNASIDVVFTDAVTGTRQIQMLGLAGPYVQITREAIPDIRGLNSLYGFLFTPGPWIEGIQLSKGVGSVTNGFEGMTGAINVELRKPKDDDHAKIHINLYGNEGGRMEANFNLLHKFDKNVRTAFLLHGNLKKKRWDKNNDGFLDNSLEERLIALNRWRFGGKNGIRGQFGLKFTYSDQNSGQLDFDFDSEPFSQSLWGAENKIKRYEIWTKTGKLFSPMSSLGIQTSFSHHSQDAYFGNRAYIANQNSFYTNLTYQKLFNNPFHEINLGASFQYDYFKEEIGLTSFSRNESVPGTYFEYTYEQYEKLTLVAGLRADYLNDYGLFSTPKFHIRYAPNQNTVLRLAAGRGFRTPSIFAENMGIFASNRAFVIEGISNSDLAYNLKPEIVWNFGTSILSYFYIGNIEFNLSLDYYHTLFEEQIVIDYDYNPQRIYFYNLDGRSFSNSFQAQLDFEPLDRWKIRLAYRFNDVQTDQKSGRLKKALSSRNRAFMNMEYRTPKNWSFDITANWQGSKRIPNTESNPNEHQANSKSKDYFVINSQISKKWKEDLVEIYIGAENLFDYTQENPIISSGDPFSEYFDASLIWGPVFGRMIYGGIRLNI